MRADVVITIHRRSISETIPKKDVNGTRLSPNRIIAKGIHRRKSIDAIPMEYVTRSRSDDSHLIHFLFSLQKDNEAVLKRVHG